VRRRQLPLVQLQRREFNTMGGETGPPEAGTGQVFPQQYDQQLQAKLAHVRELFAGQQLPEVEVFRSSPEHFRMRTEFRCVKLGRSDTCIGTEWILLSVALQRHNSAQYTWSFCASN
jgi:hypothetical protein